MKLNTIDRVLEGALCVAFASVMFMSLSQLV